MTVQTRLAKYDGFVDVGIMRHGFAPHMRDYDIIFEAMWGKEEWGSERGTYLLRLNHCPEATCVTSVSDSSWNEAWSDLFIDHARWQAAGEPQGFVWGACWSTAYPGLSYVEHSRRAGHWSERLGQTMHEAELETEAFLLSVVFHDFTVTKLSDDVHVVDKVIFPLSPDDGS